MRIRVLLLLVICTMSGCNSGSSESSSSLTPSPNGRVEVSYPTSSGTYTTYLGEVQLGGRISWLYYYIKTVTWENTLSGVTGTVTLMYDCGLSRCWTDLVPLQEGENLIKIFGDGAWADSITVTRTPSFGVSGTVSYVGAGQLNIKLTLADISNASSLFSAYTDSTGFYNFTYIPAGSYSLTPTDPCYTFTPQYLQVNGTRSDISAQNFYINAKPSATISGRITYALNGLGVNGAFVTLSSATTSTVLTNPDGYYTFTCASNGTYTATPSLYSHSFNPLNRIVTVTGGADVPGQDFTEL